MYFKIEVLNCNMPAGRNAYLGGSCFQEINTTKSEPNLDMVGLTDREIKNKAILAWIMFKENSVVIYCACGVSKYYLWI